MGKQRNVGREIALSLGAAVVLGGGFALYLLKTIPSREELSAGMSPGSASSTLPAPPDDLVLANAVFEGFGAELASKRYDAAYARMAAPYRSSFSLEAFRASCERSPFLAGVQRAGLLKTTRMVLADPQGSAAPASPFTVKGQGVLASAAGSIDASVTLLVERGEARILVLSLGGIPVLDGVSGPPQ